MQKTFQIDMAGMTTGDYQSHEVIPAGNAGLWDAVVLVKAPADQDPTGQVGIFTMSGSDQAPDTQPTFAPDGYDAGPSNGNTGGYRAIYDLNSFQALNLHALAQDPVVKGLWSVVVTLNRLE